MSKINEIIIVLAAIVTITTGIIGYINWAWVKDNNLIVGSVIVSIVIVFIFVKKFSNICKFFKWLSTKYFKFVWKITGMEKQLKEENTRWETEFEVLKKELAEAQENNLYHYLKGKYNPGSNTNVEISIKSKTFKRTSNGYECNSDDYEKTYNKIHHFGENEFEIKALEYSLSIPYEKLDAWWHDKSKSNKINLYLNMAVVLCQKQLKLEDLDKIRLYGSDNG